MAAEQPPLAAEMLAGLLQELAARSEMMRAIILAIGPIGGGLQHPRAEGEIHFIPKGYVGWVIIAFRAANGEAPAHEGDARLYRIPQSGILITQAEPNVGSSPAWRFFLEEPDGARSPITLIWSTTVHDTDQNRTDPSIGIFYLRRGRQQAGRMPCDIDYDQYFVGTKAQLLSSGRVDPIRTVSEFVATNYQCRERAADRPLQPSSGAGATN